MESINCTGRAAGDSGCGSWRPTSLLFATVDGRSRSPGPQGRVPGRRSTPMLILGLILWFFFSPPP